MSLKQSIHNAMRLWMIDKHELDVAEVIEFDEEIERGGYCETCAFDETIVEITYWNSQDERCTYRYTGNFAQLIDDLASY